MTCANPTNGNATHEQQLGEASNQKNSESILHAPSKPVNEYPDPHTVKGRVLGAMLHGDRLTQKDAWLRFGSATLTQTVFALKRAGWPVKIDPLTVKTTDAGRPALIGVYHLSPNTIADTGKEGQIYAEQTREIESERKAAGRSNG